MNEILYRFYVYFVVFAIGLVFFVPCILKYMKKPFGLKGEYQKYESNFYILLFRKLINYGIVAFLAFWFVLFSLDLPRALSHNYKETTGTVTNVYASAIFVDGCSYETGETNLKIGDKVLVYNLPFTTFAPHVEKISEQEYSKLRSNKAIGKIEYLMLSCVIAMVLNLISRFILKLKHSKDDLPEGYVISNVNKTFLDVASIVLVILLFIVKYL